VERRRVLCRLAGLLKPGSGRLIISVPNRRRRFRSEQRAQSGNRRDEIRYIRRFGEESLAFSYKLFDNVTFRSELQDAGFELNCLKAESLAPEAGIANSALLRTVDRLAAPLVPAALGYGLLAIARPTSEAGKTRPTFGTG
jgi:tRNA (uracil-5-)-methyltransferase TRM9